MKKVTLYTTEYCGYCMRAKSLLASLAVPFEEIDIANNENLRKEVIQKYNWFTVPMIFIGEKFIGGYDELSTLHYQGTLQKLLNE